MKNLKKVAIFLTGMFLGIASLLFVGVLMKNGFPQISQAANGNNTKNLPPVICGNWCTLNGSNGDIGDRFQAKNFTSGYFANAQIQSVDFTNASFVNADLFDIILLGVNFTNVDFSNANLTSLHDNGGNTFTGAIWSNTTCPDGTNSNNNGGTCIGHGI